MQQSTRPEDVWKEQRDFAEELGQQNSYVQTVHLADPIPVLVGSEVRRKLEAERTPE